MAWALEVWYKRALKALGYRMLQKLPGEAAGPSAQDVLRFAG